MGVPYTGRLQWFLAGTEFGGAVPDLFRGSTVCGLGNLFSENCIPGLGLNGRLV
jgi:hypothetical protein